MTSRCSAASATVVTSTPSEVVWLVPALGDGTRPKLAFIPTRPENDAGMRVEPPPSLAVANGTSPAATAAAVPPLEPPGVRLRSQGLRATPSALDRVYCRVPNSGALVLPNGMAPAARRRATCTESAATGPSPRNSIEPWEVGMPAQSSRSFTPKGTPASGPTASPAAIRASTAAAAARAPSGSRWTKALRASLPASMAARHRSSSSVAE